MLAAVSTFTSILWFAGSAMALPRARFASSSVSQAVGAAAPHEGSGVILVRNRGRGGGQRGGGGGGQRAAGGGNRGNFNSNSFHGDVSNSRNANRNVNSNRNVNRNANVNANRNVAVVGGGGCCYGDYDSGPSWGGVAAGVAVGAVVGAAASSASQSSTYAAPPPTYPPGYVAPPPY